MVKGLQSQPQIKETVSDTYRPETFYSLLVEDSGQILFSHVRMGVTVCEIHLTNRLIITDGLEHSGPTSSW